MLRTHSDHTQDTQCTCTGHTLSCKQDTQNKHCSTQDTLRTRGDNTQDTHRTHNAHTQDTHYHENRTHTGHTYLLSAQVPPHLSRCLEPGKWALKVSWVCTHYIKGFWIDGSLNLLGLRTQNAFCKCCIRGTSHSGLPWCVLCGLRGGILCRCCEFKCRLIPLIYLTS